MGTKGLTAVALALVATLALGQGRGGGTTMGGGRGGDAQLLQRPDVRGDLKLSADQVSRLDALQARMRAAVEEIRGQGGDREAWRERMRQIRRESEREVAEVLSPEQRGRLREIGIQLAGNRAVLRADVQDALGLTQGQRQELVVLQETMAQEMRGHWERVQNQEIDREEVGGLMRQAQAKVDREIEAMLTPQQKARLKELGGVPFKADPNWRPPRGR